MVRKKVHDIKSPERDKRNTNTGFYHSFTRNTTGLASQKKLSSLIKQTVGDDHQTKPIWLQILWKVIIFLDIPKRINQTLIF